MGLDTLTCAKCGTPNFPSNVLCKECGYNVRSGNSPAANRLIVNRTTVPQEEFPQSSPQISIPSVAATIQNSPTLTAGKRIILALSWIGVIGCIGLSALNYVGGMAGATTVFQQIGTIANSLLLVVAPYCFARAVSEIARLD